MIKYGEPQQVEDYFASKSMNQSYLKELLKGVDNIREDEKVLYYEEKGHFVIGSAVDIWLTQGKENFNNQHYVFGGTKPSDTIMSIVQMVFDRSIFDEQVPDGELMDYRESVIETIDFHNYQANWKLETRVNKIYESGTEYFEQLKLAYGKQILSKVEMDLVYSIVMSFETGKYTAKYFQDQKNVDKYHQVGIYFNYEGLECKALLDKIIIDREKKTIQPFDIKTMAGHTISFPYAVKARRYDFQAAFYMEALSTLLGEGAVCNTDLGDIEDFRILPFVFLVETTETKTNKLTDETMFFTGKALAFELSYDQIMIGKYGRPELTVVAGATQPISKSYPLVYNEIKGFTQAIELYNWHREKGFYYDKEVIENNGLILIK